MKIKQLNTNNYKFYQDTFHVSELCAKVLASKNMSEEEVNKLLFKVTSTDTFDLSFLDDVISRLQQAKINKEKIIVCGDYDCDGICATTIMVDALRQFGIECGFYIPNRFNEGYGLQVSTVEKAIEKGYHIIITVDNGVKALQALQLAKDNNIEIILSDHHQYNNDEIIFDYFIHPNIFPSYFQNMCGAGVAFLLSKRLLGNYPKHTILACVATIGDVMCLTNANRDIVKEGIQLLNSISYLPLQLLQNDTKRWDAQKIAFQIVPKINCVGRLADEANANTMVQYLLLEDDNKIQQMLYQINTLNQKRKDIGAAMENVAISKIDDNPFQVLFDESFHEGLNGIVASKIVSLTQKPVMVLSKRGTILKGSIRSNGIDLSNFFDEIKDDLIAFGGHKEAAGIAFDIDKLDLVKVYANQKVLNYEINDEISCIPITSSDLRYEEIESLDILQPMGCGFEMPLFSIKESNVSITQMSNGKHIKYTKGDMSFLFFNQGHRFVQDSKTKQFEFIGQLQANNYWGKKSINMIVDYIVDNDYNK